MTAQPFARTDSPVGCVLGTEIGVARVLTDGGVVRASFGGSMLARIARDRTCLPGPGDWVVLRRWPDHRVTIEDTWSGRSARILPLRRR